MKEAIEENIRVKLRKQREFEEARLKQVEKRRQEAKLKALEIEKTKKLKDDMVEDRASRIRDAMKEAQSRLQSVQASNDALRKQKMKIRLDK